MCIRDSPNPNPSPNQVSLLHETALHLKRVIEAAVLRAHPEWAGSRVGEDVQAVCHFLLSTPSPQP